jgi:acetyltransferase-like isoleucine patch superfamily enzyme
MWRLLAIVLSPRKIKEIVTEFTEHVSIGRMHAFGEGLTLPAPESLESSDLRFAAAVRVWTAFRRSAVIAEDALLGPSAWAVNLSGRPDRIRVGSKSVVRGIIRVESKGTVSIGDYSYVGDDTIISAQDCVTVGNDVLIAHGCQIFDNTSHPLSAAERAKHYRAILAGQLYEGPIRASAVIVADGAWLGLNSIIMRGVKIGAGSVVAAGSVVLSDVAPLTTVGGNPARNLGSADP